MLKIAIIFFRECLEISFLLGIILAVTQKIQNARIYIIIGIMFGIISSSFFAFGAKFITVSYFGLGDEIFDLSVMLLTVIMIIWTIVWVQRYAVTIKHKFNNLEKNLTNSAMSHTMLILLIATTVLREGVEIILMIYSISISDNIGINDYLLGGGIGAILGFITGYIIYNGLMKFSNNHMFKISTILLMLIAAGISAKAAGILTSAGFIEYFSNELWDSSWLIKDTSNVGKFLNAIMGYTAKPNQMQGIFYFATIAITICLSYFRNDHQYESQDSQNN